MTIARAAAGLLLLAGCSAEPGGNDTADPANRSAPATPEPVAAPVDNGAEQPAVANAADSPRTVGGDGSDIVLNPLTEQDVAAANLSGELACSFATKSEGRPLLLARGNVASDEVASGIVKIADYVERVGAPGGYDAMAKGTRFAGKGTTIAIAITGKAQGGGESPPRPATLTFDRADGAQMTVAGVWTCGP